MSLLFAVLVVAGLAALLLAGMTSSSRVAVDPIDPEAEERWLVDRLQRHPRVAAWVADRLDHRRAGGLALTVGLVALVGTAALVGWLLSMVSTASGLATWDGAVAEWGASRADSASVDVLRAVTELGSTWPALALLAAVGVYDFARRRNPAVPAFLATVGLGVLVLNNVLKLVIDRDRPDLEQLVSHAGSSFPSGHSAMAAACWAATALVLGRGRSRRVRAWLTAAAALVAFSVAASRALLGVHWLTDVLAGVALGWGWFTLVAVVFGGRLQRLGEPVDRLHPVAASPSGERSSLTVLPVGRRAVAHWVGAYVVMTVVVTGLGFAVVDLLGRLGLQSFDVHISRWFVARRTETLDTLTRVGSGLSDTLTVVIVATVLSVVFVAVFRRWHESTFLVGVLVLEASVFVTASALVGRDRPPVEQLDHSPPTASFPSGHVGAAVALYVSLAIVVFWRASQPMLRALALSAAVLLPIVVALSRLYRGMHYLTDVVAGAMVGCLAVVATAYAVRVAVDGLAHRRAQGEPLPGETTRLSLVGEP